MANVGIMNAADTVYGSAASVYVTIGGIRYNFAHVISLEASAKKTKTKVPILGSTAKGNKATGVEYTGKMTMHYNNSILRQVMYEFTHGGADVYFDIQVVNNDPTSAAGRQTTTLKNCNLDEVIIAKVDADTDDVLEEDCDFTFEDWNLDERFTNLAVLEAA